MSYTDIAAFLNHDLASAELTWLTYALSKLIHETPVSGASKRRIFLNSSLTLSSLDTSLDMEHLHYDKEFKTAQSGMTPLWIGSSLEYWRNSLLVLALCS